MANNLTPQEVNAILQNVNRQYVGARYVPKFADPVEWNNQRSYEPLTIVTYLGDSYTSKIPVPTGIAITNTQYWARTGAYNSQVEQYRQEVVQYQGEVTALAGGLTALGNKVTTNTTDITDIKNNLEHNHIIDNGIAVWLGDSYVGAASLGDIPASLDNRFSTLVSKTLGLEERNFAVGGMGYINGATIFRTQLTNAITNIGDGASRVKYVFVGGGRNDYGNSYSSMVTAVNGVVTAAMKAFPNAKIVIIPLLWDWKPIDNDDIFQLYGAIVDGALIASQTPNYNVQVLECPYKWMIGMPNMILWQNGADVHYNVLGHTMVAKRIISALSGKSFASRHYQTSFLPKPQGDVAINGKIFLNITDENMIIHGWLTPTANTTMNFDLINETSDKIALSWFIGSKKWLPINLYDRSESDKNAVLALRGTFTRTGETTGTNEIVLRYTEGTGEDFLIANHNYWFYSAIPYGYIPDYNWGV